MLFPPPPNFLASQFYFYQPLSLTNGTYRSSFGRFENRRKVSDFVMTDARGLRSTIDVLFNSPRILLLGRFQKQQRQVGASFWKNSKAAFHQTWPGSPKWSLQRISRSQHSQRMCVIPFFPSFLFSLTRGVHFIGTKTSSTVRSPHSAKTSTTTTPSPGTPLASVMGDASTPSSSVHDPISPPKSAPVSKKLSWWEETEREYDELEYGAGPSGFRDDDEFDGGDFAQMHVSSKCIDDHFLGGARNDAVGYIEPWEEEDGDEMGTHYGVEGNQGYDDQGGSLWDEQPAPVKQGEEEILCPEHGNICKKGICEAYSVMIREKRRIAREQAGDGKSKGKGKKWRKGKGKGKEMDEGTLENITCSSQRGDDPWENATMSEI
jgi:hypothetical protein